MTERGPFIPQVGAPERSSRAVALFRLGHLGVSMWVQADVLWFRLACWSRVSTLREGADEGVQAAATRLSSALLELHDVIPTVIYNDLKSNISWFEMTSQSWIEQVRAGRLDFADHVGSEPPWEVKSRELWTLCDNSIPGNHAFRPLLDLGIAFGKFDLLNSCYYSALLMESRPKIDEVKMRECLDILSIEHPSRDFDADDLLTLYDQEVGFDVRLPEIGELARRASSIRPAIRSQSPLLESLSKIGHDLDQLDEPEALRRYFEENRACFRVPQVGGRANQAKPRSIPWYGPDGQLLRNVTVNTDNLPEFDNPMSMSWMATMQVRQVEQDLAKVPDADLEDPVQHEPETSLEAPRRPEIHWDEISLVLTMNNCFLCKIPTQATHQRAILAAFQEKNWSVDHLTNPLLALGNNEPNSLSQAVRKLNRNAKHTLCFYARGGMVRLRWMGNVQNVQGNDGDREV